MKHRAPAPKHRSQRDAVRPKVDNNRSTPQANGKNQGKR